MSRAKRPQKGRSARHAARASARRPARRPSAISTRSRREPPARRARRAPARANGRAASALRRATEAARPIARRAPGWSTLRVVWQPAIAMATLPVRVYRVYRWAEAERARSLSV